MKKIILFCFLFISISNVSEAQKDFQTLEQLIRYFYQYHANFPKEHVYVHTDRSYYTPGEDIWFKGYITLGNFNRLSNLSNVVYVDLVDEEDILVESLQLPVSDGIAIGDFVLPASLSNGTYRMRAYTNWMRNFDQANFFEREIRILHPFARTLDKEGINKAMASDDHSSEKLKGFDLEGYGIAVNNFLDNSLIVELQIDSNKVNDQELHFLIQHDGQIFVANKITANKASLLFNIPRKALGDGTNEIILLSKDMKPLAQRKIVSLPPSRQLKIELKTDKKSYAIRERVKVDMSIGNEFDSVRAGTFSVSVVHQGEVPDSLEGDKQIVSSLLLANKFDDLSEKNIAKKKELDSLLVESKTHDLWHEIVNSRERFAVEKGLNINGHVETMNGQRAPNALVNLFSQETFFFAETIADLEGNFQFNHLFFNDSTQFIIQAETQKGDRTLVVVMNNEETPVIIQHSADFDALLDEEDKVSKDQSREQTVSITPSKTVEKNILLSTVEVKGTRSQNKVKHSANLNGPGNADQVLYADQLKYCFSLESCLPVLLVGVRVGGGVAYSTRTSQKQMKLIVDGIPRQDYNLSDINPYDVETIEVLRSGAKLAIYGSYAGGGLLIITTNKGVQRGISEDKGPEQPLPIMPRGFSKVRNFISPNYSKSETEFTNRDMRATIYWDADIITNEKGEAFFEFYTSDEPGIYKITLEGVDLEGRLGYDTMEFEVR